MGIFISNKQNIKIDLKFIRKFTLKILHQIEELKTKNIEKGLELSILLVDNKKIKEFNKKFRGVNSPTDVIAFPQDFSKNEKLFNNLPIVLGDVVISLEMAKQQAKDYRVPFKKEVVNLLVHGILHLLGYENSNKNKRIKMFKRQEEIVKKLGI